MQKELQLLGLRRNEALVYEVLVVHGPCKAGRIIDALHINRNLVYRALKTLVLDGYATRVEKNGVWHFQITDPNSLLTNMHRKEELFESLLKVIDHYQSRSQKQIVVYEGVDSYANYWLRSLERVPQGTIDYVAGGEIEKWAALIGRKLPRYWKLAHEKKIRWKSLYFELTENEMRLLQNVPIPVEYRIWKSPPQKFMGNFNVIHDSVILHTMTDIPRIVEIRDDALVTMFRNYFEMMWDVAKPQKI